MKKIIPIALIFITLLLFYLLKINPKTRNLISPNNNPPVYRWEDQYCTKDDDCVLAVRTDVCCNCPQVYSVYEIAKDENLVKFSDKENSSRRPLNCNKVACKPCRVFFGEIYCDEGNNSCRALVGK